MKSHNFLQDINYTLRADHPFSGTPETLVILSEINHWKFNPVTNPDLRDVKVEPFLRKLLPWEEYKYLLDYSYDPGFGTMDCHDILLYTTNLVYYIHEYDGSTSIKSIPRNPEGAI